MSKLGPSLRVLKLFFVYAKFAQTKYWGVFSRIFCCETNSALKDDSIPHSWPLFLVLNHNRQKFLATLINCRHLTLAEQPQDLSTTAWLWQSPPWNPFLA
jgi:hypothetical protein